MSWHAVDWSQAPKGTVAWAVGLTMLGTPRAFWVVSCFMERFGDWGSSHWRAPDFGYTGHPRDSLTLRPQKEQRAIVLPEPRTVSMCVNRYEAKGFNKCIEMVKELNGVKS